MIRGARRGLLAAAIAVVAFAVAGCGGSEGPTETGQATSSSPGSGGDPRAAIEQTLNRVFVDFDASVCTEAVTPRVLRQIQITHEQDPVSDCQDNDDGEDAKSIDVSKVEVGDAKATAHVVLHGGTPDGAAIDVSMVDNGGWKLDHLDDVEVIDRDRFVRSLGSDLSGESIEGVRDGELDCVVGRIGDASNETLERTFEEADADWLYDAFAACLGADSQPEAILVLIRRTLVEKTHAPGAVIACILDRVRPKLRGVTFQGFADESKQAAVAEAIKLGIATCTLGGSSSA